jgi:hypothetical protein
MENQTILSESSIELKALLLQKAELICDSRSSIPELDIPQMVRREIPYLDDYLKGKVSEIDPELVVLAREVVRESIDRYKRLVGNTYFYNMSPAGEEGRKKPLPGLDFYDNRRDMVAEYRAKYGKWIED